ncbi:hypothetical protein [Nocardia sp. NPDC050175]|uniref:hypothetical protein n=1 Tax=Nocardia sp. NPDC050175 TaxID=3364317 RepID=UPI0037A0B32C
MTIASRQPWVEARFGIRFHGLATATTLANAADLALRETAGRAGPTNWLLDNGCQVAHRISAVESILSASCLAEPCIIEPLARLATIHDAIVAGYLNAERCGAALELRDRVVAEAAGTADRPDAPANYLVISGPVGIVADCVAGIERRNR